MRIFGISSLKNSTLHIQESMKKTLLFIFSLGLAVTMSGQAKTIKTSNCTINRFPLGKAASIEPNLVIKFMGPMNQLVRSHVKLLLNGDSLFPAIDSMGIYKTTLDAGKYRLRFCVPFWHEVITDTIVFKTDEQVFITVHFEAKPLKLPGILYGLGKPVIYIYPEAPTHVQMTLQVKDSMVFSYPRYENGWDFVAEPSGNIRHKNKNYAYLFWEGSAKMSHLSFDPGEGFFVRSDTVIEFLEHSLAAAGLNEKETGDFITYWAPKMQMNTYNYLHFVFNKDYDRFATMKVRPQPEHLIRVFMLWSEAPAGIVRPLRPQTFPAFSRKGYTIVEWGGGELSNLFKYIN
jgi:hypothetical protein